MSMDVAELSFYQRAEGVFVARLAASGSGVVTDHLDREGRTPARRSTKSRLAFPFHCWKAIICQRC